MLSNHILNQYFSQTKKQFIIILIVLTLTQLNAQHCLNRTSFKYDLLQLTSITGYHSVCAQHTGRTCCSRSNFELQAKKIAKVIGGTELSQPCKRLIINALCSTCDGDVGQNLKVGVCQHYCSNIFETCKQEYFSLDSNNQVKACREEDIICSKLSDIVPSLNGGETMCNLLELQTQPLNCWNGQISSLTKGKIKQKLKPESKQTKKAHKQDQKYKSKSNSSQKSKPTRRSKNKQEANTNQGFLTDQIKTYLSLLGFLIAIFCVIWIRKAYRMWKRQLRNR